MKESLNFTLRPFSFLFFFFAVFLLPLLMFPADWLMFKQLQNSRHAFAKCPVLHTVFFLSVA